MQLLQENNKDYIQFMKLLQEKQSKKFIEDIVKQSGGKVMAFYENEIWANSDCQYISVHISKAKF
mgnify:CR=1 FL=1